MSSFSVFGPFSLSLLRCRRRLCLRSHQPCRQTHFITYYLLICVARDVCSCVDKLMCALCMWILAHLGYVRRNVVRFGINDDAANFIRFSSRLFFSLFSNTFKITKYNFRWSFELKSGSTVSALRPEGKEEQRRRSSDDESDGGEYSKNRGKDETDENWKFIDHHWNSNDFFFCFALFASFSLVATKH